MKQCSLTWCIFSGSLADECDTGFRTPLKKMKEEIDSDAETMKPNNQPEEIVQQDPSLVQILAPKQEVCHVKKLICMSEYFYSNSHFDSIVKVYQSSCSHLSVFFYWCMRELLSW